MSSAERERLQTRALGRPIRKLFILDRGHEIRAIEDRSLRYSGTLILGLGLAWALEEIPGNDASASTVTVILSIMAATLAVLLAPWHREIRVDRDDLVCTVQRRFLYFLPISTRRYDLRDAVLERGAVKIMKVDSTASKTDGQEVVGCILGLISMPLGIIHSLMTSKKEEVVRKVRCLGVAHRRQDEENGSIILLVDSKTELDELITAFEGLLNSNKFDR